MFVSFIMSHWAIRGRDRRDKGGEGNMYALPGKILRRPLTHALRLPVHEVSSHRHQPRATTNRLK